MRFIDKHLNVWLFLIGVASLILFTALVIIPGCGWIVVKALSLTTIINDPDLSYGGYWVVGLAIGIVTGGIKASIGRNK